jgi:hypothetical protein
LVLRHYFLALAQTRKRAGAQQPRPVIGLEAPEGAMGREKQERKHKETNIKDVGGASV